MKQFILVAIIFTLCFNGTLKAKEIVLTDSLPTSKTIVDLFKTSDRIELVAYPMAKKVGSRKTNNSGSISDGKFIVADVQERISLTTAQTKSLFSILSRPRLPADSLAGADCYTPQHAIVFYQSKVAAAFLEICFSCHRERHTSEVDFGTLGQEKYCLLEQFFIASKINYGIEKEEYKSECGELLDLK